MRVLHAADPQLQTCASAHEAQEMHVACFLTLCFATMQVSHVKAEADKQVAQLTSSLTQAQSQAAGISRERERLAAQVQQQAATIQAAPEVGTYPSSKQGAVTLQLQPTRDKQAILKHAPAQKQTSVRPC